MDTLMQDIRYGIRMLMRNPGFLITAVLTLALGIGANTAIFSVVNGLLLRPLPVPDAAQITVLGFQQQKGNVQAQFSEPTFHDIRSQSSAVFSEVFAYQISLDGLSVDGKADRILTNYVSGNFFTGLGFKPQAGRFILPTEGETAGADPVMVIAYAYWKSRFGGDPGIVGRQVSVDGRSMTIIGIAPKGFMGVSPFIGVQGFLPLGMLEITGTPPGFASDRHVRNLNVMARLRRGTTLAQAQAALAVIGQRLAQQYPQSEKDVELQVYPELHARPQPDPKNTLLIIGTLFLGLAALVLLLACVNVANLLLVRAAARGREMAIRSALGAARFRLIRQLLVESILLALLGGVAGLFLGYWGGSALTSINVQTDLPVNFGFGFDWRVFGYATLAALLTGVMVGIMPAVRASRGNLSAILHEGGRGVVGGKNRLRSTLVAAQVAGSFVILIIAGLFARSLGKAQQMSLGFDPDHVVNFVMDPLEIGYNQAQTHDFYKNLLERARSLPGVVSASTASSAPMGYFGSSDSVEVEGYQPPPGKGAPSAFYNLISADYLQTMQIPLLRGRTITGADDENSQYVAIVSEVMAKQFWPDTDPVGRHFQMMSEAKHPLTVVGVAGDIRYQGATGPFRPVFYLPFAQHQAGNSLQILQVRTAGEPSPMIPEIERSIQTLAPQLPVFDAKTMRQALYTLNGLLVFQLGAALAALLGALGLILAIVGVYGVVSYATSQKSHEIGVRMALGAQQADILKMIFRDGLVIVAIGLGLGVALALAAGRVVSSFVIVSAKDPLTYIVVTSVLLVVALAACFIPARRATRVDPLVALRYE
jgi:predicted permease